MVPPLIGKSKDIERIRELIIHVANTGLNTVISGESGVGKEVVAHNLYHRSRRKDQPFIKINCAALPEGLLESELFGFERGAFTGAERKKRGNAGEARGLHACLMHKEVARMAVFAVRTVGDHNIRLHLGEEIPHRRDDLFGRMRERAQ